MIDIECECRKKESMSIYFRHRGIANVVKHLYEETDDCWCMKFYLLTIL